MARGGEEEEAAKASRVGEEAAARRRGGVGAAPVGEAADRREIWSGTALMGRGARMRRRRPQIPRAVADATGWDPARWDPEGWDPARWDPEGWDPARWDPEGWDPRRPCKASTS